MPTGDERANKLEAYKAVHLMFLDQRRSLALWSVAMVVTFFAALTLAVVFVWDVLSSDKDTSLSVLTNVSVVMLGFAFLTLLMRRASALAVKGDGTLSRLSALLADGGDPSSSTRPTAPTHRSIHHLFGAREHMLPKPDDPPVALALDTADLPEGLLSYLELLARNDIEARVLLLDPGSPLVSRHRFAAAEGSDDTEPPTESLRAKMRKAIASVQPLANVRLYDAMPLGNLVIVGDRIFWGGIPSVPTDVSLPVVELATDIHGDLYWSYRRNFDHLWDVAKPANALVEPSPQSASQAG